MRRSISTCRAAQRRSRRRCSATSRIPRARRAARPVRGGRDRGAARSSLPPFVATAPARAADGSSPYPAADPVIAAICWWVRSSKKASCTTVRIRGGNRFISAATTIALDDLVRRRRAVPGRRRPARPARTPSRSRTRAASRSATCRRAMPTSQPPRLPRARVERGSAAPGPDEHLLGDVLGVVVRGQTRAARCRRPRCHAGRRPRAAPPGHPRRTGRRACRRARTRGRLGPAGQRAQPGRTAVGHRRFSWCIRSTRPGWHYRPARRARSLTRRRVRSDGPDVTPARPRRPHCPGTAGGPVELATACDQGQPRSAVAGEQLRRPAAPPCHPLHLGDPVAAARCRRPTRPAPGRPTASSASR